MSEVATIGMSLIVGAVVGHLITRRLMAPAPTIAPRDILVDLKANPKVAWEVRVSKENEDEITWKVAAGNLDPMVKATSTGQVPYSPPPATGNVRKSGPLSSGAQVGQSNDVTIKINGSEDNTLNGRIIIQK